MFDRDELQWQLAQRMWEAKTGILLVAPRVGKTRIALRMLLKIPNRRAHILVSYPDVLIRQSWEDEMREMGFDRDITFTSTASLWKYVDHSWEFVIIDECHQLSEAQIASIRKIKPIIGIIGMSGTMSQDTKWGLKTSLNWPIVVEYTQEQAIFDGIVADYQINVLYVPLDRKVMVDYKKKKRTEKGQFDAYSFIISKLQREGRNTKFLALARMRIIQNSLSKLSLTKKLLEALSSKRVLVFCGLIKVAEQLGIPVEHSKTKEDNMTLFLDGQIKHLAVVKMGAAGITYKPLNTVIINYFNSNSEDLQQRINRAMNLEFDNPDKKADIYIISSDEEVERKWLSKALTPFDKNKIKHVYNYE